MNMTKLEDELRGLEKRLPYGVRAKLHAYADATLDAGEWNRDDEDHWDVVYLRVLEAKKALLLRLSICPEHDADECATARERSVAGVSDTIPACPVHGALVQAAAEALENVPGLDGEAGDTLRAALKDINDICAWVEKGDIDADEAFNQIGKLSTPPNFSIEGV